MSFDCKCFLRYSTISHNTTDVLGTFCLQTVIDIHFLVFCFVFQINARTELALRYNDISPLENHHCAVAFEILEKVKQARLSTSVFKLDNQ